MRASVGQVRAAFGVLAFVAMSAPHAARADRRDVYTLLGYEAGVSRHEVPVTGDAAVTQYAGALDVTAYYGFTNALHVGGRLRFGSTSNLRFGGVTVAQGQGRTATGDAFADDRSLDVGGIVLWRVNTSYFVVPVLELGAGLAVHQYRNVTVYPSSGGGAALASSSEAVAYGSATALLEYRFRDRWVAAAGVGAQVEGGRSPWSILVPFRVGYIW